MERTPCSTGYFIIPHHQTEKNVHQGLVGYGYSYVHYCFNSLPLTRIGYEVEEEAVQKKHNKRTKNEIRNDYNVRNDG